MLSGGGEVKLEFTDMCFGCGKKNECGLMLNISFSSGKARSEVIFKEVHQGWRGIVHGGVISAAIDEVMAYAIGSISRSVGVTAELTVRFKKPVKVGEEYELAAEVIEFNRRKAVVKGWIKKGNVTHAEGKGIYVLLKEVNI